MLVDQFQEVEAVYFDLDDTLCAYWNAAKHGLKAAFEDHPEHGFTTEELQEAWSVAFREFVQTIGKTHWYEKYRHSGEITRAELMRRTLERLGNYDEDLALQLSHTYHVERQAALELFPEAKEVLENLYRDYPLGLITNGPADIQQQEIEVLNIREYFENVLIEGELGFGKPDPRVMELAQDAVGLKPHQILFVGNSYHHDMIPAQEAGWRTAWVRRPSDISPSSRTGKIEEKPEDGITPDITISDLRELIYSK